jgi:hypothetical protein
VVSKPEGYVGTLSVTWENGEKNVFEIAQSKGHIWVGEHSVSVRNEKSMQGILREISDVMSYPPKKVKQYTWLELISPIKFSRI